ncbi:MAG: Nin-like protein [Holophagales bacterium]|nr:Nin-like protein [Holophagales bacterium]MYG29336.1 Nin-like protein [Holophagales bacterium]MYI81319.1 Nin-like protein [Holophagales bacterium]
MNPYLLPATDAFGKPRRYVLNVSGGRTSGFLLRQVLDANDGRLPPHVVPVFANTGKEREETLVFLDRMDREWNVGLRWLEYRHRRAAAGGAKDPKHVHGVVDFATAARKGEPFEAMIRAKKMLPHVVARMCTDQLKVSTIQRYVVRSLGWPRKGWTSVLGIRADEPRRIRAALMENCTVTYPLALADVTLEDVDRYWRQAPFDLGIRSDQGNCDLCFLKGKGKLLALIAEEPELADWWIEQEDYREAHGRDLRKPEIAWFRRRENYRELRRLALSQPRLAFADGPDDAGASCFCGDG